MKRRQFLSGTAAASALSQGTGMRRTIDAHVSAGDDWWIGDWMAVDSSQSIREAVALWADLFRMQRIYWRGQQEELAVDYQEIRPENLLYHEYYTWTRRLVKEAGLNRILVREAHKRGMEVHMWAPLFDFTGPADTGGAIELPFPAQMRLTLEHPEWLPLDRHGFRRQTGPVAFCYPEARKALIDIYLGYFDRDGYDAIAFFTYCEGFSMRFDEEFGFNEPAVAEFRKRYGIDVRTQEYDRHAWAYLLGEYVTLFMRELKDQLRPRGRKIGLAINAREPNYPQPWMSVMTAGRMYLDWEGWVREGLIDDLQVWCTRTPMDIQLCAIERCLDVARGTPVTVGALTASPASKDYGRVTRRGARIQAALAGEAQWVSLGLPEQPAQALRSDNVYLQMRVLAQAVSGETRLSTAEVIPLLSHSRMQVRRMAVQALQQLNDPAALPAIFKALDDPETSVRCAAVRALAKLNDASAVDRLAGSVRRYRQFQLFEATSATLASLDSKHLPAILALAGADDPLLRRMALYVLGRRTDASQSVDVSKAMLRALSDSDAFVRFRAVEGLAAHCGRRDVVDSLIAALADPHFSVSNRASTSLALGVGPTAVVHNQPWYNGVLRTFRCPRDSRTVKLTPIQERVLDALTSRFLQFGDGYAHNDADWGFRVVGNAMLAFGTEGRLRLERQMEQRQNKLGADLAWRVLYVPQSVMAFEPFPGDHQAAKAVFERRPLSS